jgi:tetratricopeptide (TPR) repeat protein
MDVHCPETEVTSAAAQLDPATLSKVKDLLAKTTLAHDLLVKRRAPAATLQPVRQNLAQIHLKLGRHFLAVDETGEAVSALRQASAFNAADAGIHALLAQVHARNGEVADAIRSFRRAVALRPGDAGLLAAFADALAAAGQAGEALAVYRQALAISPGHVEWLWRYGALCNDLGAFDEARDAFRRLIALQPGRGLFHRMFGKLHGYAADDPHIAQMQALLPEADPAGDDARELHFALFNAYENAGDYDRAFGHLKSANDIRKRQLDYRPEVFNRLFENIEAAFSQTRPAFAPSPRTDSPIFVVGMPRSGSTLVEQILDSHPDASAAGETTAFAGLVEQHLLRRDLTYDLRLLGISDSIQAFGDAYLAAIGKTADITRRTVDKYLTNFLSIGIIKAVFPQAKIVHCHRTPLANCFSAYASHFETGGLGFKADMEETARYYVRYVGLMRFWKRLYGEAILDLSYERLTLDQEAETRRLLAYCGLDWNPACLDFHRNGRAVKTASYMQVRQPLYSGVDRRTAHYIRHLEPMIRILEEAGLYSSESRSSA